MSDAIIHRRLETFPSPVNGQSQRLFWWLLAAVSAGALVRVYLALAASVIARDAVQYVTMARRMATDWRAELAQDYPLGFPFLIRCAHAVIGSHLSADTVIGWQRSGQFVSLAFGIACIPLVYWLAHRLLGARCGLLAAWIWALLPQAAALSADALTDMPNLALMLGALALLMIGSRAKAQRAKNIDMAESHTAAPNAESTRSAFSAPLRELLPFFAAGLLSGAAYTIRTEGAEVVVAGLVATSLMPLVALRWRLCAAASMLVGFALVGGSYMLLEGKVITKQPWIIEEHASLSIRYCIASAWTAPFKTLAAKLSNSLNGIWLIGGLAYPFLPGRRRVHRQEAVAPVALWTLHTFVLLWLYARRGYISSRHVMLLDVAFVIFSAGTLVWLAERLRAMSIWRQSDFARWSDGILLGVIAIALSPWLLRDINFNRHYIREAANWIARDNGVGRQPSIVAPDGWVPFYAGATHWAICRGTGELRSTAELAGADYLVLGTNERPPASVRLAASGREILIEKANRFIELDGKRGVVVYHARTGRE